MATQQSGTDQGEHYTIITADCHAGGSHAMYREYLDPQYREDFDAWRGEYKNPFRDLGDKRRYRNWDEEMRESQQLADGVIGEILFPNTVPPFFPNFVLFAPPPKPEEYEHRIAGVRAHNRWLVDFCAAHPERRAGIGQIFLNDVDDALDDIKWIKENGLRGGVLIPPPPPDATWVRGLYHPDFEPIWELCEDLGVTINTHSGTGQPAHADAGAMSRVIFITETHFYSQRPLVHLMLSGVFERHPRLKYVNTELGCAWVPPLLDQLDRVLERIRDTGQLGENRYTDEQTLPRSATEYFRQNCWLGVSFPKRSDAAVMDQIGIDRIMWGSDYPHDEGTYPFTRESLRQLFCDWSPEDLRTVLSENAAKVYDFDLEALAPLAEEYGPTVDEIRVPLTQLPEDANFALTGGTLGMG